MAGSSLHSYISMVYSFEELISKKAKAKALLEIKDLSIGIQMQHFIKSLIFKDLLKKYEIDQFNLSKNTLILFKDTHIKSVLTYKNGIQYSLGAKTILEDLKKSFANFPKEVFTIDTIKDLMFFKDGTLYTYPEEYINIYGN